MSKSQQNFGRRGFGVNPIVCKPPGGLANDVEIRLEGKVYPLAGFNFPPTTGSALQYGGTELTEIPVTIPTNSNNLGFTPTPFTYGSEDDEINWSVNLTGDTCSAGDEKPRQVVIWHEYTSSSGGPPYVLVEVLELTIETCDLIPPCTP